MSPLWGTFSDCWSCRSRCKTTLHGFKQSRIAALAVGRQGDIFSPLCILFIFAVFLALSGLETSGGKNSVLFYFHTISGAIREHALSPRLRWGFYMVHKHKHTAHSCLCTGKERAVKAGAFFIIQHQPEAPHIQKWDYTWSVSPSDSRIHCFKKR